MSLLKTSAPLLNAVRRIGTSEVKQAGSHSKNFQKLKANQEKYQINDGTLIHLKGGFGDKIMYQATMGLCVVGVAMVLKLIYTLSVPRKN